MATGPWACGAIAGSPAIVGGSRRSAGRRQAEASARSSACYVDAGSPLALKPGLSCGPFVPGPATSEADSDRAAPRAFRLRFGLAVIHKAFLAPASTFSAALVGPWSTLASDATTGRLGVVAGLRIAWARFGNCPPPCHCIKVLMAPHIGEWSFEKAFKSGTTLAVTRSIAMSAEDTTGMGSRIGRATSRLGGDGGGIARNRIRPGTMEGSTRQPGLPKTVAQPPAPKKAEPDSSTSKAIGESQRAVTKRSAGSRPDRAALEAMVRDTMHEAELAFAEARAAKLDADLQNPGLCGFARIVAYSVKPPLREILKKLDLAVSDGKGAWNIATLTGSPAAFGIRANAAACDAACGILRQRLGDHAEFYVQSFLD